MIKIAYFGSLKTRFVKSGVERYCKWLKPYVNLSLLELKSGGDINREPVESIQKKEAAALLKKVKSEELIILDEGGEALTSKGFSTIIKNRQVTSRELFFAIGGYTGFHEDVKRSASKILSLSRMTFTHEMALLLLTEQIYRSMKIIKGEKYHY
ncbi:MAG: rRNA (pseudouridine1915-N3)-methyltransferase [Thermotogaceae bacterium]|jgi:23S rRNA (pseudouridine1915-N3)-methyltransferase|nr:rRNA (pseudouridine1915-N3)-methyltransferase [Thermotogaceae bacterium]